MLSSLTSIGQSKPATGSLYDALTSKSPRKGKKKKKIDPALQQLIDIEEEAKRRLQLEQNERQEFENSTDSGDGDQTQRSQAATAGPRRSLSILKAEVVEEIADAEVRRRRAKLQTRSNQVRNAMKQGPKTKGGYSIEKEEAKIKKRIQTQLKEADVKESKKKLVLDRPLPVVLAALYKCAQGVQEAEQFMVHESSFLAFMMLDMPLIRASLDCWCSDRMDHAINYKFECLWRLAYVCEQWTRHDGAEHMRRIAYACYVKLLEVCDAKQRPTQFHALCSSLAQCQEAIDEHDMVRAFEKYNTQFAFDRR